MLGARVVINPFTLVVIALFAYYIATRMHAQVSGATLVLGLALATAVFASIFVHELAHAIVAKSMGRQVHEIALTMWGGHTAFDSRGLTPLVSGAVAAAGPAANVALYVLAMTAADAGVGGTRGVAFLTWLGLVNLLLAAFNSLPGTPLDGGRVVESIVWGTTGSQRKGLVAAAWLGRLVIVGVAVAVLVVPLAAGRGLDVIQLVWVVFIASLMWPATTQSLRLAQMHQRFDHVRMHDALIPSVTIHSRMTVDTALDTLVTAGVTHAVVRDHGESPTAVTDAALLASVPAPARAGAAVMSASVMIDAQHLIDVSAAGFGLVSVTGGGAADGAVWVVMDGDAVAGVVTSASVRRAMQAGTLD